MTHSPKMLLYSLHSNDTVFKILHVFNRYLVNVNQIPDPVLDSECLNKNRLYCAVGQFPDCKKAIGLGDRRRGLKSKTLC